MHLQPLCSSSGGCLCGLLLLLQLLLPLHCCLNSSTHFSLHTFLDAITALYTLYTHIASFTHLVFLSTSFRSLMICEVVLCLCSHCGPGVSCALCVFISDPLCFMTVHLWSPCLLVWCACIQALVRAAGSVCGPGGNYGHAPREEADPLSPTLSCSCLSFGVAASPYLIPLRQTTRLSSTFGFFGFQDIF